MDPDLPKGASAVAGNGRRSATRELTGRPAGKPVRKDEIVLEERGLYVESWLPERRSRRRPLYYLHGELGGSWLWERYLRYFAQRGWEGHALNLRAHFWSQTADVEELSFDTYLEDAMAGFEALERPAVVVGHGLGGLLAMKVAESHEIDALILISPAIPAPVRPVPPPHVVRLVPAIYQAELIDWAGSHEHVQRQNPDLSLADVRRIQHLMGAESGAARRQMLAGVYVDRDRLPDVPVLVIGAGLDRQFAEADSARLADWLGAEYQPFGAHSHYGTVLSEQGFDQVADTIRSFLEHHRL
ncbi:MAG: alpha/beta hydrolase [Candidatus Limnocylindrales bacterium]